MFPFRVSVDNHELTLIAADGLDVSDVMLYVVSLS